MRNQKNVVSLGHRDCPFNPKNWKGKSNAKDELVEKDDTTSIQKRTYLEIDNEISNRDNFFPVNLRQIIDNKENDGTYNE